MMKKGNKLDLRIMNKLIVIAFLLFVIVITSGCTDNEELEGVNNVNFEFYEEETDVEPVFIPSNWTDYLREVYNKSKVIDYLKYNKINTITINNETKGLDKLIVIIIPDDMENRGYFDVDTNTKITNDDEILIGNDTVSTNYNIQFACLFISKSLAEEISKIDNPYYSIYLGYKRLDISYIDLTV